MILVAAILLSVLLLPLIAVGMARAPGTGMGDGNFSSSPFLIPVLVLALGLGLFCHLSPPGDIPTGDGPYQVGRIYLYRDLIQTGELPIWSNRWYCGFPLDMYYGFAFYPLPAALSFLPGMTVFTATKTVLWLFGILSGVAMFLTARAIFASPSVALLVAAAYAFSTQHVGMVLDSGNLPVAGIFAFLPLSFLVGERYRSGKIGAVPAGVLAGGILSLLVFFHVQYGILAAVCFFLLQAAGLFRKGEGGRENRWVFPLAVAGFFAGFVAWFILPFLWETRGLVLWGEKVGNYFINPGKAGEAWETARSHMFAWRDKYSSYTFSFKYPGNTLLILGMVGTVGSGIIFGRDPRKNLLSPILLLILPGAGFCLLNPRFVNIWFFFLCLAAGQGALLIEKGVRGRFPRAGWAAVPVLLLLVLADLAPHLDYAPYQSAGPFYPGGAPSALAGTAFAKASGRYSVITRAGSPLWRSFDTVRPGLSSPFGAVPQSAPRSYLYAVSAHHRASEEYMRDGRISETAVSALRLFGVSFLLVPWRGELISLPHPSVALFAPDFVFAGRPGPLEAMDWHIVESNGLRGSLDSNFLEEVVKASGLDSLSPRASALVLPAGGPGPARKIRSQRMPGDLPAFMVSTVRESPTRVLVDFEAGTAGYLQLAYSFWPWNRVLLDGREVRAYSTALHLTMIEVPAGRHTAELKAGLSLWRYGLILLALATAGAGIVLVRPWKEPMGKSPQVE